MKQGDTLEQTNITYRLIQFNLRWNVNLDNLKTLDPTAATTTTTTTRSTTRCGIIKRANPFAVSSKVSTTAATTTTTSTATTTTSTATTTTSTAAATTATTKREKVTVRANIRKSRINVKERHKKNSQCVEKILEWEWKLKWKKKTTKSVIYGTRRHYRWYRTPPLKKAERERERESEWEGEWDS